MRRKQPWLIATAAVVAALTLYYYTGSWIVVMLFSAALAALVAYRAAHRKRSSHACLRCGATLNPNARHCTSCGSASWTIRE
jgi:ribosomal protein L40E